MLRQSTLNQLKRINGEIKKQGGTIDRKSDSEKGMPNAMWVQDPIDADKKGKRKIATYDQMFSIDIPDADTKVKMKNEIMKNIKSFEEINENGPNDSPQDIMKNMKRINNWFSEDTPTKEINQLLIGKQIDTGKVKGFVQRIEGDTVFIQSVEEPGFVKVKLKDAVKGYKPEKEKAVADFSIQGPNNKSLGGEPSVGKSFAPKIDAKATAASDQSITTKNNTEKYINKLSDMAIPFDGKTTKPKSDPVAPSIDKKGTETSDSKSIGNKIYKTTIIKKYDDNLAEPMKTGKAGKSENTPGKTLDTKTDKAPDNSITKKNTSVKKFTDMSSDFEGPKK